jgi:excisionase family DNA binding protein
MPAGNRHAAQGDLGLQEREMSESSEFLTKRELAELCRCSERTVDRLLEQRSLPVIRLSPRRIIFPVSAVRKWLEQRTQKDIADATPRRRGRPPKAQVAKSEHPATSEHDQTAA